MEQRDEVAVLGLGDMGGRLARNLLDAGHEVRGWNRSDPSQRHHDGLGSLVLAGSPQEAAEGADVVISVVSDDDASAAVWSGDQGALAALGPEAIAVECSTISPTWSRNLAELSPEGRYLEAPMVGSLPQLDARQLVHLTGGLTAAHERARPVLEASAAAIHHVGSVGSAATLKLAVNTLLAAQVFVGAELVGLLGALDEDEAATALELLAQLPVTSPALARTLPSLAADELPPKRFPLHLVAKDLRYGVDAATANAVDAPVSSALAAVAAHAVTDGWGEHDITAIARALHPQVPETRRA